MDLIEVLIKVTWPRHHHQVQRGTVQSRYQWRGRVDLYGQHLPGANVGSALYRSMMWSFTVAIEECELLASRMDGLMCFTVTDNLGH